MSIATVARSRTCDTAPIACGSSNSGPQPSYVVYHRRARARSYLLGKRQIGRHPQRSWQVKGGTAASHSLPNVGFSGSSYVISGGPNPGASFSAANEIFTP